MASPIVQAKSLPSGPPNSGSGKGLSCQALVLSPLQSANPMNTSEPIPAASRPGSRSSVAVAPPSPTASMMITAPMIGEPKIVEMAAKLPAAASSPTTCWGASFLRTWTAKTTRPMPRAISGDSGPSTSPRPRVASAASRMPGTSRGSTTPPPVFRPSAGTWPPPPGRRTIATAVSSPASASHGSGHQAGIES